MNRASRSRTAAGRSPFVAGELLPRFAVRDENGHGAGLLSALEGGPSILLYLPQPASPAAQKAARHLAQLESPIPRLTRALLVPPGTRGAEVVSLADLDLKVYVSQKPDEAAAAGNAMVYAITDTAGRVLKSASLPFGKFSQIGAHIGTAFSSNAETSDSARVGTAPVLMIPDVLAPSLCKRLVAHFEQNETHPSGVLDLSGAKPEWRPDPAIKSRRDMKLEDPELAGELEQAVVTRVLPEIHKCFYYVVTHHEPFKLVRYDEGSGYFRPHRDNETDDTLYRRFAMTLNLNAGDYEGGALEFPEFGTATYRPPTGGAIVFSCSLLHEATDVTRGHRYVALGFFYNPADGLSPEPG
ncbi:MAG: 2OG-Fe(II) oxygenase [Gammaproteobacteria bacterium]